MFGDLRHVVDGEGCFAFAFRIGAKIAHASQLAVFPNPRVWIVGADAERIAPGVDGNEPIVNCRRDVHRAAVDADGELGGADEMNQLQERGLIRKIQAIVWRGKFTMCLPNKNHAHGSKGAAELGDDRI